MCALRGALLALLLLASTSHASTAPPTSPAPPLPCEAPFRADAATGRVLDRCGRQRLFRGFNAVQKSAPFILPSDAWRPGGASLAAEDAVLWRSLGQNLARLGIMWQGAFPRARGEADSALLAQYAETAAALVREGGVHSLLDAHQDGFSPLFCDDGAPPWAARICALGGADAFPMPLSPPYALDNATGLPLPADCASNSNISLGWAEYYLTSSVGRCFGDLYAGPGAPTSAAFSEFWRAVVAAFAGASDGGASVLAYELLNEPWAGDVLADPLLLVPGVADAVSLQPFYANLTAAIRAAEAFAGLAPKIVAMEPVTWDVPVAAGFSRSGAWPASGLELLSYHYYSLPDVLGAAEQVQLRAADALRLGAAALLTEFDAGLVSPVNPPYSHLDMRATLDACDAARHGYIGWVYGSLFQGDNSGTTLYVPAAREFARPAPLALAGGGADAAWRFSSPAADDSQPRFELNYTHSSKVAGNSSVFLSTGLWFDAARLRVTVSSQPAGAVAWRLQRTPGQLALPASGTVRAPAPAPFDFALLEIFPASSSPPALAAVQVVVDLEPQV